MKSTPRNLLKLFNQQTKTARKSTVSTEGPQTRGRAISDDEVMCFIYNEIERFKRYQSAEDEALFDEKSVGLLKRSLKSEELVALLEADDLKAARGYVRQGCKRVLINTNTRRKGKGNVSLDGLLELGIDPSAMLTQTVDHEAELLRGAGMPSCPRALVVWLAEPERVRRECNLDGALVELLLSFPLFERRVLALAHATTLSTAQAAELLSDYHGSVSYNQVNNTRARKLDPVVREWAKRMKATVA